MKRSAVNLSAFNLSAMSADRRAAVLELFALYAVLQEAGNNADKGLSPAECASMGGAANFVLSRITRLADGGPLMSAANVAMALRSLEVH